MRGAMQPFEPQAGDTVIAVVGSTRAGKSDFIKKAISFEPDFDDEDQDGPAHTELSAPPRDVLLAPSPPSASHILLRTAGPRLTGGRSRRYARRRCRPGRRGSRPGIRPVAIDSAERTPSDIPDTGSISDVFTETPDTGPLSDVSSETQDIVAYRFLVDGKPIVLIDTPGLDDTNLSDANVFKQLSEWFANSFVSGQKLAGIVLMQNEAVGKVAGSRDRFLAIFESMIGFKARRNVAWISPVAYSFAFKDEGQNIAFPPPAHLGLADIIPIAFDGSAAAARQIVVQLSRKIAEPLAIQQEIVDERRKPSETTMGQELLKGLSLQGHIYEKQISDLEAQSTELLLRLLTDEDFDVRPLWEREMFGNIAKLNRTLQTVKQQIDDIKSFELKLPLNTPSKIASHQNTVVPQFTRQAMGCERSIRQDSRRNSRQRTSLYHIKIGKSLLATPPPVYEQTKATKGQGRLDKAGMEMCMTES